MDIKSVNIRKLNYEIQDKICRERDAWLDDTLNKKELSGMALIKASEDYWYFDDMETLFQNDYLLQEDECRALLDENVSVLAAVKAAYEERGYLPELAAGTLSSIAHDKTIQEVTSGKEADITGLSQNDLNAKLYEKIEKERDIWASRLAETLSGKNLLDASWEYWILSDVMKAIKNNPLPAEKCRALLVEAVRVRPLVVDAYESLDDRIGIAYDAFANSVNHVAAAKDIAIDEPKSIEFGPDIDGR